MKQMILRKNSMKYLQYRSYKKPHLDYFCFSACKFHKYDKYVSDTTNSSHFLILAATNVDIEIVTLLGSDQLHFIMGFEPI